LNFSSSFLDKELLHKFLSDKIHDLFHHQSEES
jgi:hypothetical protein